jgi:hypothetical protein
MPAPMTDAHYVNYIQGGIFQQLMELAKIRGLDDVKQKAQTGRPRTLGKRILLEQAAR